MLLRFRKKFADWVYPEGQEERRSLLRLSNVDELTGLGNKHALLAALPAAEADPDVAIIVFDMNNLGKANKQGGHRLGDRLIRRAGRTIQIITKQETGSCRGFRFGGDEFVLLISRGYDVEGILKDICYSFGTYEIQNHELVSLSGSIGNTFKSADAQIQSQKKYDKGRDKNWMFASRYGHSGIFPKLHSK